MWQHDNGSSQPPPPQAVWTGFGFSTSNRPKAFNAGPNLNLTPPPMLHNGAGASTEQQSFNDSNLYCDACEKEFTNSRGLIQHLKTHVKCDQCSFTAIPKVVNEHKSLTHAVARNWGYAAADIAKWREERRKNYPTEANSRKRELDEQSREQRGQVAEKPTFRVGHPFPASKKRRQEPLSASKPADNNEQLAESIKPDPQQNTTKTGLSALAQYSSSDESDKEDETLLNAKEPDVIEEKSAIAVLKQEEAVIANKSSQRPSAPANEHEGSFDPSKLLRAKRYKATLLERLLAKEVQHERNVVLQCIRFIVQHKCFGLEA